MFRLVFFWLRKAWRVLEGGLEAGSSTFLLKVDETPIFWPEERMLTGAPVGCHNHVELMQWRHLNVFNKECLRFLVTSSGSVAR
jgi:hypothetical protein